MSVTLAFIALDCGTNFEKLGALVFIIPFKTLTPDVIAMRRGLGTRPIGLGKWGRSRQ